MNLIRKVLTEIKLFLIHLITTYPNSGLGNRLRKKYFNNKFGKGTFRFVGQYSKINSIDKLQMGSNISIGENNIIDNGDSNGLYIGSNCAFARNVFIRTANHKIEDFDKPFIDQGHDAAEIIYNNETYSVVIEENSWIAANCVILTGAHIGKGATIGAGSVVSGRIPDFSIAVGNPARVMGNRLKMQSSKNKQG